MATNARLNKAKGRNLQNLVLGYIERLLPKYKGHFKSRTMGENGTDIEMSPLAKEVFPYSIECKYRNSMAIYKMFEQAEIEAKRDHTSPMLVCRASRKKALVVMDIEDFFHIMKTYIALTGKSIGESDTYNGDEVEVEFDENFLALLNEMEGKDDK